MVWRKKNLDTSERVAESSSEGEQVSITDPGFWTYPLIGIRVGSLVAVAVNADGRIDQDGKHMIICYI